MRRLWPVAVLVILGAGLGGRAHSVAPPDAYLPDLRTLDPSQFHVLHHSGQKLLLLSNTVWNGGDGPLEMRPEHVPDEGITKAYQLLYTEDGDGNLVKLDQEHAAGSFAFHPSHRHWHFQDLARYELVEMKRDRSKGETVAASEKISFCMFDQRQIDPGLENAAGDPLYAGSACDQNTNVGYSVSWGDEYAYNFADQDIDVTGVEPGRYWVVSTADPEDLIEETNDRNNAAQTAIRLGEERARSITETTGSICSPCGRSKLDRGRTYAVRGLTDPTPGPRPAYPTPAIELSFKRPGADDWRPFGVAGSKDPFTLVSDSGGYIASDGSWERDFVARKSGAWILRARYGGNDSFTHSAAKVRIEVGRL